VSGEALVPMWGSSSACLLDLLQGMMLVGG